MSALHSSIPQRHGLSSAGSRPILVSVPTASGSGAPQFRAASIGRVSMTWATTPRAACAAWARAGSTCTTLSMASTMCRVRQSRASSPRSISRRTSHVTMACIARMVAAPLVSCVCSFIPLSISRRTRGSSVALQGRFLPDCRGHRAPAFFLLRVRRCRQANGGRASVCPAYPFNLRARAARGALFDEQSNTGAWKQCCTGGAQIRQRAIAR